MKSVSVDVYSVWAASAQGKPQLTLVKPDCFSNDSKNTAICVRTRSSFVPKQCVLNCAHCFSSSDERALSRRMLCSPIAVVNAVRRWKNSVIGEGGAAAGLEGLVVLGDFLWGIVECGNVWKGLGNVRALCIALSARVLALAKIGNQFFLVAGRT